MGGGTGRPDPVRLWLVRSQVPADTVAALAAVLDSPERARAAGMSGHQYRRFVVAHGAVRFILGQQLGVPPPEIRWRQGRHGKPELAGDRSGTRVNLSHSGELVLVAVSPGRPVGVDVQELRRRLDPAALAVRFFPPAEARFVAAAGDSGVRLARFTRLWTRKEASVKAAGGWLLQATALPVHPARRGTVLVRDPTGVIAEPYLVRDVPVPAGFHAAVAVAGAEPFRISRRWWAGPAAPSAAGSVAADKLRP